jgi:hypothetical protein
MAANIVFRPFPGHESRAAEILNELEARTEHSSEHREHGERSYFVNGVHAGVDAFDEILDNISADWRDHIERLSKR